MLGIYPQFISVDRLVWLPLMFAFEIKLSEIFIMIVGQETLQGYD